MTKPKVLIITGYGINCDEETSFAFSKAGGDPKIVHINDLLQNRRSLQGYQILAFPGGFSYGDDTGSGNALANKIQGGMWDDMRDFLENRDKLVIGICNGFQVLARLGAVPAFGGTYGPQQVALVHNDSARYTVRWVDLIFPSSSPWTRNIEGSISLPIAHGEGKFYAEEKVLEEINEKRLIAARYVKGEICKHQGLEANPNGALEDIAGITDESGRVFGLMPHPERAIAFTQLPHWTFLKEMYQRSRRPLPEEGPGMQIFRNGIAYFK